MSSFSYRWFLVLAGVSHTAYAESPARERELTCADGTTFLGEQVRNGLGRPPHLWRVIEGVDAVVFSFHAATVVAPDGTIDLNTTWDDTQGVEQNHDLITCSFVIPVGPLTGYRADYVGYFIP